MISLDLFAGCGGLALGVKQAGFRHVALIEQDPVACETLLANLWQNVVEADSRTVRYKGFQDIDLLTGGVPCQPFSMGGKALGPEDDRDLWPEAIRAVRAIRPRAFMFENVRGITRPKFRGYLTSVLERLASAGYTVRHAILNAADFGIPQRRERCFVVGFRLNLGVSWVVPEATHSQKALEWSKSIGMYWTTHGILPPQTQDAPPGVRVGDRRFTVRDALVGLPEPRPDGPPDHRLVPGARSYPGHTGSSLDEPAKTIKAGVHGCGGGENMLRREDGTVRYFTVRELARLQTFPDSYRFPEGWGLAVRQIGNAVPVLLARMVAEGIRRQLDTSRP